MSLFNVEKYWEKTSILCSKETVYPLIELLVLLVAQVNFSFTNYTCRKSEPFYSTPLEERAEYLCHSQIHSDLEECV